MRSELSTNSHELLQMETLKRYRGGGEQTMRSVATARGGRLDGGSSRLDLAARRTSMIELHRLNFLAAAAQTDP